MITQARRIYANKRLDKLTHEIVEINKAMSRATGRTVENLRKQRNSKRQAIRRWQEILRDA